MTEPTTPPPSTPEYVLDSHRVVEINDSAYNSPTSMYDSAYESSYESEDEEYNMIQFRNGLIELQRQEVQYELVQFIAELRNEMEFEMMIGWLLGD
tara:strand:+ start:418 stop:705 length:288 start_codon:yes stop_codon:yes gene_type:complete